jgi:GTPase SAR1 family protein
MSDSELPKLSKSGNPVRMVVKVIPIGATGVGKTAIYCRILEDTFDGNTLPTVTGQAGRSNIPTMATLPRSSSGTPPGRRSIARWPRSTTATLPQPSSYSR